MLFFRVVFVYLVTTGWILISALLSEFNQTISMRKGLKVYGHVEEGRGKCVRKPAKEERRKRRTRLSLHVARVTVRM